MSDNTVHPAVVLAVEQSETHHGLAEHATTDAERRAHLSTVRALDKAAMEMARGNIPQHIYADTWLVNSRTHAGVVYHVNLGPQTCTCKNGRTCWHLAACNVCHEAGAVVPVRIADIATGGDDDINPEAWDLPPQSDLDYDDAIEQRREREEADAYRAINTFGQPDVDGNWF